MRVSTIINSNAGASNPALIREKIEEALFRCDLSFADLNSKNELSSFVEREIAKKTDAFIVCGGDGTINFSLQEFMKYSTEELPPFSIIGAGTANDLASELGVSRKVNRAARMILEGKLKQIDVIRVESEIKTAYMLTNGGLGLPALTADFANIFRQQLRELSAIKWKSGALCNLALQAQSLVKRMGPSIYGLMIIEALRKWDSEEWGLEFTLDNGKKIETDSPIVLVNNQPSLGSYFIPAPYTSNNDGTMNLLIVKARHLINYISTIYALRNGRSPAANDFVSYELESFSVKNPKRSLTFFGDGEILQDKVNEIHVSCLPNRLTLFVPT